MCPCCLCAAARLFHNGLTRKDLHYYKDCMVGQTVTSENISVIFPNICLPAASVNTSCTTRKSIKGLPFLITPPLLIPSGMPARS